MSSIPHSQRTSATLAGVFGLLTLSAFSFARQKEAQAARLFSLLAKPVDLSTGQTGPGAQLTWTRQPNKLRREPSVRKCARGGVSWRESCNSEPVCRIRRMACSISEERDSGVRPRHQRYNPQRRDDRRQDRADRSEDRKAYQYGAAGQDVSLPPTN